MIQGVVVLAPSAVKRVGGVVKVVGSRLSQCGSGSRSWESVVAVVGIGYGGVGVWRRWRSPGGRGGAIRL